jgi:hypothetical protein
LPHVPVGELLRDVVYLVHRVVAEEAEGGVAAATASRRRDLDPQRVRNLAHEVVAVVAVVFPVVPRTQLVEQRRRRRGSSSRRR